MRTCQGRAPKKEKRKKKKDGLFVAIAGFVFI